MKKIYKSDKPKVLKSENKKYPTKMDNIYRTNVNQPSKPKYKTKD